MGPPIFIGGNLTALAVKGTATQGFNGATDFHRWKWRRRAPGHHPNHRFNGATDFHRWKSPGDLDASVHTPGLQWGHRFSSVEMAVLAMLGVRG